VKTPRLSLANNATGQKVIVTAQNEAHGSIRQEMRALAAEQHLQSQFEVIINAISGSVEVAKENKFYFTHVYYRYDNDSRRFLPGTVPILEIEIIVLRSCSYFGHYFRDQERRRGKQSWRR
jgi:hypothetical protein